MEHDQRFTGRVKWFNASKGFGFVVVDEPGQPDILLHINVLRSFGQSSVADGARIELTAQESRRGFQATSIISIDSDDSFPAESPEFEPPPPRYSPSSSEPLLPARVKWFDKLRGFGFANVFGKEQDIFLHMEVLRQSGLSDLQPGEAISIRITDGPRGKMASEIRSWESAVGEHHGGR